jgi:hypothetical protein
MNQLRKFFEKISDDQKVLLINRFHSIFSSYLLFGWIFESQRKVLVFIIPTLQFQFSVNNNMCILTQLENRYLKDEKKGDSFIGKKLKEYNIQLNDRKREIMINSLIYLSFFISYWV